MQFGNKKRNQHETVRIEKQATTHYIHNEPWTGFSTDYINYKHHDRFSSTIIKVFSLASTMSAAKKSLLSAANFAKEREEFERKKKELEAEMKQGASRGTTGSKTRSVKSGIAINTSYSGASVSPEALLNFQQFAAMGTTPTAVSAGIHGSPNGAVYHSPSGVLNGASSPYPIAPTQGNMNLSPTRQKISGVSGNVSSAISTSATPGGHGGEVSSPRGESAYVMQYVPPGRKVSDWYFTDQCSEGNLPPVVKSQDIYFHVKFLGRGAFGSVDQIRHNDDSKLYALKSVLIEKDGDEARYLKEVFSLRLNRHAFVVAVKDVFLLAHPRKLMIVLHFCDGGDLAKVITTNSKNGTKVPESTVLKWCSQVALGLQFIHYNNTLHRDIKPSNILLVDNYEYVKIADFGLATRIDASKSSSLSSAEVGTPYYTSPEMIRQDKCSFPSDVWSFGVLLHELLNLALPFDGGSTEELVRGIMNEDPPPIQEPYSVDIATVSRALLIKDPNARMTLAEFLGSKPLVNKVLQLPNTFRPKAHCEERLRRAYVRQLNSQIQYMDIQNKTDKSTVSASNCGTMTLNTSMTNADASEDSNDISMPVQMDVQDDALCAIGAVNNSDIAEDPSHNGAVEADTSLPLRIDTSAAGTYPPDGMNGHHRHASAGPPPISRDQQQPLSVSSVAIDASTPKSARRTTGQRFVADNSSLGVIADATDAETTPADSASYEAGSHTESVSNGFLPRITGSHGGTTPDHETKLLSKSKPKHDLNGDHDTDVLPDGAVTMDPTAPSSADDDLAGLLPQIALPHIEGGHGQHLHHQSGEVYMDSGLLIWILVCIAFTLLSLALIVTILHVQMWLMQQEAMWILTTIIQEITRSLLSRVKVMLTVSVCILSKVQSIARSPIPHIYMLRGTKGAPL